MSLETVFDPVEYNERINNIQKDLSWFEYWLDKGIPIRWNEVNKCYERIMSLWDVSYEESLKYLSMLNRMSMNYLDVHRPTLHHKIHYEM